MLGNTIKMHSAVLSDTQRNMGGFYDDKEYNSVSTPRTSILPDEFNNTGAPAHIIRIVRVEKVDTKKASDTQKNKKQNKAS